MRKILFFCIVALVFGRENPFAPKVNNHTMSTNLKIVDEVKTQKISTNDEIKLNQKIINNSIKSEEKGEKFGSKDKFVKIVAQQNKNPKIGDVKITQIQGEIEQKVKKVEKIEKAKKHTQNSQNLSKFNQISKKSDKKLQKFTKNIALGNFFSAQINENFIKISTKNELFRHFALKDENKIAFDFKREKTYFYTKKEALNGEIIKSIALGSHENFYRFAIKLDKNRAYKITQKDGDYLIQIK